MGKQCHTPNRSQNGTYPHMANQPLISVIMPIFNVEQFVKQAIVSILSQTEKNFELIIIDDASVDKSFEIVKKLQQTDARMSVTHNERHLGVAATANKAIGLASGQFLARMDGDDISLPERLRKQRMFLQNNPHIIAVGGQFLIIDEKGTIQGQRFFPTDHAGIYHQTFTFTALSQPGLMINRKLLPPNFLFYNESFESAEETELVFRLFQHGMVANITDTILQYRIHKNNTSLKSAKKTFFITLRSRIEAVIFGTYVPTLRAVCINVLQFFAILFLPNTIILMLYAHMRNRKLATT